MEYLIIAIIVAIFSGLVIYGLKSGSDGSDINRTGQEEQTPENKNKN